MKNNEDDQSRSGQSATPESDQRAGEHLVTDIGSNKLNLRMFTDDGCWFIYGPGMGSGSGATPEAAIRELVRLHNSYGRSQWPLEPKP